MTPEYIGSDWHYHNSSEDVAYGDGESYTHHTSNSDMTPIIIEPGKLYQVRYTTPESTDDI